MKKYIHGLDGLRTLAIIGVILYHLMPYQVVGGFLGVNLFFMISGYLLTRKLDALLSSRPTWSTFVQEMVVKRIKRMAKPLLYCMLLTIFLVTFLQPSLLLNITPYFMASLFFVNNFYQILSRASYFDKFFGQPIFTHFWYLSVLLQMTLVFVFVYLFLFQLVRRREVRRYFILAFALLSYIALLTQFNPDNITRVYYGLDTRFFDFLFGALFALMDEDLRQWIRSSRFGHYQFAFGSWIALLVMVSSFFIFADNQPITYFFGFPFFDLVSFYFLTVGLEAPIGRFLDALPFRYLGSRSFQYYLWYFPVLSIYQGFVKETNALSLVTQLLLILLMGEVGFQWFEQRDPYTWPGVKAYYQKCLASLQTRQLSIKWTQAVKYTVLPLFWLVVLVFAPQGKAQGAAELEQRLQAMAQLQSNQASTSNATSADASQSSDESSSQGNQGQESSGETTLSKSSDDGSQVDTRAYSIIGDSIILSAYSYLKETFPNAVVDGKISRQFYVGVDVINAMKQNGTLANRVIVMLGTNGPFSQDSLDSLVKAVGSNRTLFLVNVRGDKDWQQKSNKMLQAAANANSNVHLLNWHDYSAGHDDWFFSDQEHPNNDGLPHLMTFLYQGVKDY